MNDSRLFYVMGPSGAGKDSLLSYARSRVMGRPVAFAHRYITRPAEAGGENHVALTPEEFSIRLAHGCFSMAWESHGLRYGIGLEIEAWLMRGMNVVVNGSREYLPRVADHFPAIIPVAITVDSIVLRHRLEARGRETATEIDERLARAASFKPEHHALITIDNSGPLENAGDTLVSLLNS